MIDTELTIFMTGLTPFADIDCETWLTVTKKVTHRPKFFVCFLTSHEYFKKSCLDIYKNYLLGQKP